MSDIPYAELAKELVADHVTYAKGTERENVSYTPCYFNQGYSDTNDEAQASFIAGTDEWREIASEALWEWNAECIRMDADELTKEYITLQGDELPKDFDEYELAQEIVYALEQAQTQDVEREWIEDMRSPGMRVQVDGKDDPEYVASDEDITPERLLTEAGLALTDRNIKSAQVIIDNAMYPGCYYMLWLVFRIDMSDIPTDRETDTVRIVGECELWAGNPYAGDGMADTVDVDITIPRAQLDTDENASGYSYNDVFGPHWPSVGEPTLTFTKTAVPSET